jgi:glutaconyl-CoA/methylmalonyl-CoA decarboxylase subunit gamma
MKLTIDSRIYEVEVQQDAVIVNGTTFKTAVVHDNGDATVRVGGRPYKVKCKDDKTVVVDGRSFTVEMSGRATTVARPAARVAKGPEKPVEKGAIRSLMPGTILSLRVKEGQQVECGSVLLILEAMKMQNEIKAPYAGTVKRIAVAAGQTVNNGDVLVVIED